MLIKIEVMYNRSIPRSKYPNLQNRKEYLGELTIADLRESARVTENRPEVEAIDSPEPGQESESELVESASVIHRRFLR